MATERPSIWSLPQSQAARNTLNPIRAIVDNIKLPTNLTSRLIPLSIGDPTIFGNLDVPMTLTETLVQAVNSKQYNGYGPSTGLLPPRKAIAQRYSFAGSDNGPATNVTHEDVIITSGCSGALCIAIEAIANAGENILLPTPGFPLYRTIAGRNEIECKYYSLLPNKDWEIDLESVEKLIDHKTRAIVVNNPGNPTGSAWSASHMRAILAMAKKHHLPIIADEVYSEMVFDGVFYASFAELSEDVPIIVVGGIAKQFVCPGQRLGWIIIYDKGQDLQEYRAACNSLSQLIIGANTLIQSAVPALLLQTPADYHKRIMSSLQESALFVAEEIKSIEGLSCQTPQGAMYIMVAIDTAAFDDVITDDQSFAQHLLSEENVFALPGACFQAPGFVRLVLCAPVEILRDATKRMRAFCDRHRPGQKVQSEMKESNVID